MKTLARLVLCTALFFFLVPQSWAKGVTVKITVTGETLADPISITDPDVVSAFSIWSGPNSRWRSRNGAWQTDYSHTFIDFPGGHVESPPEDILRFEVEFHIGPTPTDPPDEQTYKVQYAIDPSETEGYIYLPRGNPFIHHGVEDNWFRSTQSWEALVRPVIQEALSERKALNNKSDEAGT